MGIQLCSRMSFLRVVEPDAVDSSLYVGIVGQARKDEVMNVVRIALTLLT